MKTSSYESRVNAVAAEKIMIEMKGAGQMGMTVHSALLGVTNNDVPVLHGKLRVEGNWPKEVIDAAKTLQETIEDHLIHLHFKDGGEHGSSRRNPIGREPDFPTGLGGSGLEHTEEEPEQL